ncbi:CDP-diacylglycerol--serine O-phosphatidyltransferase [Parvibaculum sp.]|uniref:CDP-diacylglycerol--serine O-phosphatidyltransferase n=1 Tax=Parvibaculum sp. TaxID=2024848 RepID=UPI000C53EDDD|nr:CDP-diacylglycerol--serine O-phosphatidyltransferase [Parvibaculum sp.]MAM94624.1 CDP-diacylglycerol--serine O-phosphatidyltransferase [Parvibaculum sp.]HCX66553.1 CDP-diacylglycerol--serine O-phosphatidyltransferase [Rhodobiaceae bacterium]|tara:strand:+ start:719 stop:1585 length:867 start_codon:yes stop_codon:yes gene_type:complete
MAGSIPPFEQRPGPGFRASETMRQRRARQFSQLPVRTIVPNSLTVLALCAGLTAIRFAIEGRFEAAVAAIIIASVFDALDGRIARMLRGSTRFGAELDSLTDFVNFGVAPVVILYLWSLGEIGGLGWIAVLGFSVCCALRLARFNVALEDPDKPVWTGNYFVGMPSPAAAGLVMLPLYLSFTGVEWIKETPLLIAAHVLVIAFLMVSQIPTFSGKRMGLRIRRDMVLPVLLLVGMSAAIILNFPWIAFTGLCAIYLASIPVAVLRYRYHKKRTAFAELHPDTDDLEID